jgi:hypothetical protein
MSKINLSLDYHNMPWSLLSHCPLHTVQKLTLQTTWRQNWFSFKMLNRNSRDWATHTSVGKENVKDCWNGQDPEERTCMLKSMSRGSLEFVRWFRNCSFRSFDTPISCNRHGTTLCNLKHLLLPQTLLNKTCLLHMCKAETVANTPTLYSGV